MQEKRSSLPNSTDFGNPSSWTSTPDLANLEDDTQANIPTVSLTLPKRKQKPVDAASRTGIEKYLSLWYLFHSYN